MRFGNRNEQVLLDSIAALEHDAALLDRCERVIGRRLYPIGYQEHQDREVIFVDESGAIYINFGATLYLIAQSFEDALVYLIGAGNYHRARLPAQKQGTEMLSWILPDESEP